MQNRRQPLTRKKSIAQFAETMEQNDEKELIEIFKMCDINKDGSLSKKELQNALKQMEINHTEKEFNSLFDQLDINKDGQINFNEFVNGLKWMKKAKTIQPNNLSRKSSFVALLENFNDKETKSFKELFDLCDTKKRGYLDKAGISELFKNLNLEYSGNELENFFTSIDTNGDGKISFNEFLNSMSWLQKGMNINSQNDEDTILTEISDSQRYEILKNYVSSLLNEGLTQALDDFNQNKHHTTKAILKILDVPCLKTLENSIGQVIPQSAISTYDTLNKKIEEKKKQKK
eukprot:TRINITY_DN6403_c0_g1_i2.p1 TRINITY_DN6403_c0_g1~~TRINITY_DN6403_c0_g1_i2.p1  ORF type:complete len:289 (+),score=89.41 TRINITY_DN6403_c0_g1_i2:55-921(+)